MTAMARLILAAALILSASPALAKSRPLGDLRLIQADRSALKRDFQLHHRKSAIVALPQDVADVIVSDPDIVDAVVRTSRRIYLYGRAVGQANVFLLDQMGRRLGQLEIQVEPDLSYLVRNLGRFLPNARIEAHAINANIVLTGTVDNASDANFARELAARFAGGTEKVLNNLSITGQEQVLLRVRVLEMQRTVLKQLGVDLGAAIASGNVIFDVATTNPMSLVGRSLGGLTPGGVLSDSSIAWQSGNDILGTSLRAFERDGLVRTLAEPNLTAISGEPASFLAGGEFPVPTSRDRDGNVAVTFKPFGVGLGFTPVVLSGGRISMRISTEVSELSSEGAFTLVGTNNNDGLTIPALSVRRAETTVELPSGGSLVIAGLIQDSVKQNIDGIPGLKNLPILGALFRSRDYRNSETELIVVVTPFLVNHMKSADIDTPGDAYTTASDLETFLLGRLTAVFGADMEPFKDRGGYGYILEETP